MMAMKFLGRNAIINLKRMYSTLGVENQLLKKLIKTRSNVLILQKEKLILHKENLILHLQKENELIKKEKDIERLQIELREKNWDLLQTHEKIYLRQFLKLFSSKFVKPLSGVSWGEKWTTYLKNKEKSLNEWSCDKETFIETFENLFEDFNKNAHPIFNRAECVEVPFNMFTKDQFKVLGFVWDNWELPLKNFKIVYSYKPPETIVIFKK